MADAARDVNFEEYDPVSVGKRLQEGRQAMGLTRRGVAEETGIPENTVYKLETGRAEPSLSRLRKLCRLYDIPYSAIMAEVDGGDGDQGGKGDSVHDPVREARSHLRQAATMLGLKVVDESNGEAVGPAGKVGADEAVSATALLNQLAEVAEDNGVNAQGVTKVLRQARNALERMDLGGLIDLADANGFDWDTLPARDEGDGKQVTMLIDRLLIAALYEVDTMRLAPDALERLSVELAGGDPDNPFESKGLIRRRGFFESFEDSRRRAVAGLQPHILKAVRRRAAPDLSDEKRYPRSEPESEE
jgi:transcriptional regulator with XRE-family HTH domain